MFLWGVVFSDLAAILAEIDVEHPVKLVLDAPMGTRRPVHFLYGNISRTDVEALFQFGQLAADHAEGACSVRNGVRCTRVTCCIALHPQGGDSSGVFL